MNEQIKSKMTREEYEMQFFGFSHTMLSNVVKSKTREEVKDTLMVLIEKLKKTKTFNGIPEESFNCVADQLNDLFLNALKIPLQNIENIIEECIAIPDHVLLPEDESYQRNQHDGITMSDLDSDIEKLKIRAVKAKYMENILKEELASIKDIIELGSRKVNELQKRSLVMKQKDRRNKELVQEFEASISLDLA